MIRILNCEPHEYSEKARDLLNQIGTVTNKSLTRDELLRSIPNYDVLVVRLRNQIDQEVLDAAKSLKVIVSATTGLDHIDIPYAKSRGIEVLSLQGETKFLETIHATAEHTWALLLALVRHLPQAFKAVKNGEWNRDSYRGVELANKRLGLIGLGRLGKRIAAYGKAFGMRVGAYDPYVGNWPPSIERKETLRSLLQAHDIVSLHIPLNQDSRDFLGPEEFASMVPGAILVNTSRGEVVQTRALLDALTSGRLSGAAIDVVPSERERGSEEFSLLIEYARTHGNLIITPHIGGATRESMESTEIFMAQKLISYITSRRSWVR